MKKIICVVLCSVMLSGCAGFKSYFWGDKQIVMPDINMPAKVKKPQIKSTTLKVGDTVYVAYTVSDSMKLYTYLVEMDAYTDKLEFRIETQNDLLKKWGNMVK